MRNKLHLNRNWRESPWGFLLIFLGCFIFFYYFNIAYIGITAKGGHYVPFLDEHLNYIKWWSHFSIESTATIIRWFGFKVHTTDTALYVVGRKAISLVYSCLGYDVMGAFTAFLIAYPSKWKNKLFFWALGIVMIQLLNILRFVYLSLYWDKHHPLLGMDHHDLFNIFIYVILMMAVYIWINYFNADERNATPKSIR